MLRRLEEKDAPFMLEWMHDSDIQKGFQKNMMDMKIEDVLAFCQQAKITDEIADVQNLDIKCTVNGEVRQDSNTKLMMQTVAGAISELSQGITLQAGTIIATGTPAGVGMGMKPPCFLKHGDEIICEVEKIGKLINFVE